MKIAIFFIFFFSFAAATTTTSATFVFDSTGEPLRNGDEYYLSPPEAYGDAVTVIKSAAIWKETTSKSYCSLAMVKSNLLPNKWPTVISTPLNILHLSTHNSLTISFSHLPYNLCTNFSNNWVVISNSKSIGYPVMVGNAPEFRDAVVKGSFFIKPYRSGSGFESGSGDYYYKIVFCEEGNGECANVGVHMDNQQRKLLVVTKEKPGLVFKFEKVIRESLTSMAV
ncbi:trypsin inhibitor DE5 alpha chain-like [Senna tora]|uniref:Trypsin inhibitor DE5 alpha chain-like n=1 Tax=Senna tora TaxID=362788 RepID=A0A834TAT3_9FABA|nr:trypsin inhibitor DE5 alpha chain-like [Senna tora]